MAYCIDFKQFRYRLLIAGNLALGKTATQSTDYNNDSSAYPASNAVNGIIDDYDFTHTLSGTTNQWWMVDLEKPYDVTTIELYNRQEPVFCEYKTVPEQLRQHI